MAVTTHTYTAEVGGQQFPVSNAAITFDAARAPLVTATFRAPIGVADDLDPRDAPRVAISATSTDSTGTTKTRVFDLVVRSRDTSRRTAEVTVSLASDDALLADYAPLADDEEPYWLGHSLQDLVSYVLGKVTGASVDPSSADASLLVTWDTTNEIPNPRAAQTADHWVADGATLARIAGAVTLPAPENITWPGGGWLRATATAATWNVRAKDEDDGDFPVTPDQWWAMSSHVRTADTGVTARAAIAWLDAKGRVVGYTRGDTITVNGGWQIVRAHGRAPSRARQAAPLIEATGATGKRLDVVASMFSNDRVEPWYLDADFPDTAQETFEWASDPHDSPSRRTVLVDAASPATLVWTAGTDALSFLTPIVQSVGLRLVCDESRVWTLRGDDWVSPGSLAFEHGVNVIEAGDRVSRDDATWFDAAVTTYRWTATDGRQKEAVDAWALNDPPTKVVRIDKATPYPGKGFSQYAVRRAQQRGRQLTATAVADWNATTEQPVTIDVPGTTYTGRVQTLTFDLTTDEMTITTRDTEDA